LIRRLELINFMSHRHSVIELSNGLTVLVGPNNCGKSAVVTALKILAHNDVSTYVKRHGEKECRVKVELIDDEQQLHTIEWSRKNSPQYTIDGKSYDRLRNAGLPPRLAELLKLPIVQGEGGNEFDIHFGEQKSPVFLLDKSASQTAQFFASSSDAAHLVAMQKLHLRKVSEAKAAVARLDQQELQVRAELEKLEPAVVLQQQLTELEQLASEINAEELRATALGDERMALAKSEENHRQLSRLADCLRELPILTELADVSSLQRLVADLPRQSQIMGTLQRQSQALSELASPPQLAETNQLQRTVDALTIGNQQTRALALRLESLAGLPAFPELADTDGLHIVCRTLKTSDAEYRRLRIEHGQTDDAIRSLSEEWEMLRRDAPVCPTCGQDLPADFLDDHQHDHLRHDAEHELPRARQSVVPPATTSKLGEE
jgi:DNA repair ATPase RecN